MKLLAKIAVGVTIAAAGATMYAAPGDVTGDTSFGTLLGQAQNLRGNMGADYSRVIELQMISRKEKDVIKLNCVNDKLVAMKPEMNIADQSMLQLQSARNQGEAKSAFDTVSTAAGAVSGLRSAAEACVGQTLLTTESSNDYTHPDIPDSPESNPFSGGGTWSLEPPAYASPVN